MLGQQKLSCNCVTNPLVPTTCCFFWPNKYPRELGLGAFSSSHPWWGREALARVSNKFPYCKLHCFEESSFPTGDSDYGQNNIVLVIVVRFFITVFQLSFPIMWVPARLCSKSLSPSSLLYKMRHKAYDWYLLQNTNHKIIVLPNRLTPWLGNIVFRKSSSNFCVSFYIPWNACHLLLLWSWEDWWGPRLQAYSACRMQSFSVGSTLWWQAAVPTIMPQKQNSR